jgi:TolB-like protein
MSPTGDDVRRQLDRLLASSGFANAVRMSRFLKFVVEHTLAGEGERLKEYVISVEVFDRDTSYDPRVDSIVRVEAARLRTKLAEYYAGEGRGDAIVLTVPKGGYAAVVKLDEHPGAINGAPVTNGTASLATPAAQTEQMPRPAWRAWAVGALSAVAVVVGGIAWAPSLAPVPALRLAVMPFTPEARNTESEAVALRLTEGVTAELVRDGRFSVVASSAARAEHSPARRPRDIAAALDADIVVEARVTTDGERIGVEARAASGQTEQKLWVRSFAGDSADTDALEREIAAAVADELSTSEFAAILSGR